MTLHRPRSVFLIFLFSGVSLSLAVFVYKDMDQSTLVQAGDTVSLKCDYQLDTELYSIKVSEYLCRDPSDCYCVTCYSGTGTTWSSSVTSRARSPTPPSSSSPAWSWRTAPPPPTSSSTTSGHRRGEPSSVKSLRDRRGTLELFAS